MPTAAKQIELGPFIGGLNTKSDQSALSDNELYVCENFELDFDGSLRSRPPITSVLPMPSVGNWMPLGNITTANGTLYTCFSGGSSTYGYNGTSWVLMSNTVAASAIVQFNGKTWLVADPNSGQWGGTWDGTSFTQDLNMPRGHAIAAYKELLYISSGGGDANGRSRLYRSNKITDSPFWPPNWQTGGGNWNDIGYGDGEEIRALVTWSNQILIFRSHSIWTYSWSSTPAGYGTQPLETSVGLDGILNLDQLDGVIYFTYNQRAYSFNNGRAQQLNERVPFTAGTNTGVHPTSVSVFGSRVLFSFYDTLYVYSAETYTWSSWKTPAFSAFGKFSQRGTNNGASWGVFLPGSDGATNLLKMDEAIGSAAESFTCTLDTKIFDFDATSQFKRLFWWGVDAMFRSNMTATVIPVVFWSRVTWGQAQATTFGAARQNTWGNALHNDLSVRTTLDAIGIGPQRKFVKLAKSLRFRQAHFRVVVQTDGSTNTAPVKVFGITTFVRVGERAVKTIS